MSPKFLTALGCAVATFNVLGQKIVFTYSETPSKNYSISSSICVDEDKKTLCLMLKDNEKVEFFLFSPDFKLLSKLTPPDGLKNTAFAYQSTYLHHSFVNENGFNFVCSVHDKSVLKDAVHERIQTVNFEKKETSADSYFVTTDDEAYISLFVNGNKYYHLCANDKTGEIIVYSVIENGKIEKHNVPVNLKQFYDIKKAKFHDYFSFHRTFTATEETGLKQGSDLTKFFVYPDKVIIVGQIDKEPPHILTLDLKTYVLNKEKLSMQGFCGFEGKKERFFNNSYIFENRLYVVNVCDERIELGVFNPETRALITKQQILKDDDSFFAGDVTSSKTVGKHEKEKELKTSELIKKMMKGSVGIAAAKNSNGNIVLTCGTYDETIVGGGGYYVGGFSTASMPIGGTYAGSNVPKTTSYQNFNPNMNYKQTSGAKATLVTSFKLVFDSAKSNILTNEPIESRYDKITDYSQNFQPSAQGRSLFSFNGKLYFGFYDADKKQYVIQYLEDDK